MSCAVVMQSIQVQQNGLLIALASYRRLTATRNLSRSCRSFDSFSRGHNSSFIRRPLSTLTSKSCLSSRMSELIVLTAQEVDKIIDKLDLQQALQSQSIVFQAYSAKRPAVDGVEPIQTPQRLAIQSDKSTTLFMPARVNEAKTACKIVAIPKQGGEDGLPGTTLVVNDEGRVLGVVNSRKLTALRNACGRA